jgi:hypothetical protein
VNVRGTPGKDKERGLERILGQVGVRRHPSANTQHHRAESADQFGKCSFVPASDEPGEQLPIGRIGFGGQECPPELSNGCGKWHVWHWGLQRATVARHSSCPRHAQRVAEKFIDPVETTLLRD